MIYMYTNCRINFNAIWNGAQAVKISHICIFVLVGTPENNYLSDWSYGQCPPVSNNLVVCQDFNFWHFNNEGMVSREFFFFFGFFFLGGGGGVSLKRNCLEFQVFHRSTLSLTQLFKCFSPFFSGTLSGQWNQRECPSGNLGEELRQSHHQTKSHSPREGRRRVHIRQWHGKE